MKKNTPSERLINGIIKENPTFVLMLGMCPTLAITTSAINGIGMGLTTTVILAASNLSRSPVNMFIPGQCAYACCCCCSIACNNCADASPGLYPVFVFFPPEIYIP